MCICWKSKIWSRSSTCLLWLRLLEFLPLADHFKPFLLSSPENTWWNVAIGLTGSEEKKNEHQFSLCLLTAIWEGEEEEGKRTRTTPLHSKVVCVYSNNPSMVAGSCWHVKGRNTSDLINNLQSTSLLIFFKDSPTTKLWMGSMRICNRSHHFATKSHTQWCRIVDKTCIWWCFDHLMFYGKENTESLSWSAENILGIFYKALAVHRLGTSLTKENIASSSHTYTGLTIAEESIRFFFFLGGGSTSTAYDLHVDLSLIFELKHWTEGKWSFSKSRHGCGRDSTYATTLSA